MYLVRAAIVERIGAYKEVVRVVSNVPCPTADDGELLVKVDACGLAFPDVSACVPSCGRRGNLAFQSYPSPVCICV